VFSALLDGLRVFADAPQPWKPWAGQTGAGASLYLGTMPKSHCAILDRHRQAPQGLMRRAGFDATNKSQLIAALRKVHPLRNFIICYTLRTETPQYERAARRNARKLRSVTGARRPHISHPAGSLSPQAGATTGG